MLSPTLQISKQHSLDVDKKSIKKELEIQDSEWNQILLNEQSHFDKMMLEPKIGEFGIYLQNYLIQLDGKIQEKVNLGIEAAIKLVAKETIDLIESKMQAFGNVHQYKLDMIEVKLVRKNIELMKKIADIENCSYKMFHQNQQIRESMEIERAHAKRERAESENQRSESRQLMFDMLRKESQKKLMLSTNGIQPNQRDAQSQKWLRDTSQRSHDRFEQLQSDMVISEEETPTLRIEPTLFDNSKAYHSTEEGQMKKSIDKKLRMCVGSQKEIKTNVKEVEVDQIDQIDDTNTNDLVEFDKELLHACRKKNFRSPSFSNQGADDSTFVQQQIAPSDSRTVSYEHSFSQNQASLWNNQDSKPSLWANESSIHASKVTANATSAMDKSLLQQFSFKKHMEPDFEENAQNEKLKKYIKSRKKDGSKKRAKIHHDVRQANSKNNQTKEASKSPSPSRRRLSPKKNLERQSSNKKTMPNLTENWSPMALSRLNKTELSPLGIDRTSRFNTSRHTQQQNDQLDQNVSPKLLGVLRESLGMASVAKLTNSGSSRGVATTSKTRGAKTITITAVCPGNLSRQKVGVRSFSKAKLIK